MGLLYSVVYDLLEQIQERMAAQQTRYYDTWAELEDTAHVLLRRIDDGIGVDRKELDNLSQAVRNAHELEQQIPELVTRVLEPIAAQHLGIRTLETRGSSLDFPEVSVWGVKDALIAAYEAGKEHAAHKSA